MCLNKLEELSAKTSSLNKSYLLQTCQVTYKEYMQYPVDYTYNTTIFFVYFSYYSKHCS